MGKRKSLYDIHVTGTIVEVEPGVWRAETDLWALTADAATPAEAAAKISELAAVYIQTVASEGGSVRRALERERADYTEYPPEHEADLFTKLGERSVAPSIVAAPKAGLSFSVSALVAA